MRIILANEMHASGMTLFNHIMHKVQSIHMADLNAVVRQLLCQYNQQTSQPMAMTPLEPAADVSVHASVAPLPP